MTKLLPLLSGLVVMTCLTSVAAGQTAAPQSEASAATPDRRSADEFNRRFIESCRKMDHQAAASLWADNGVDLLPGMEPMVGKAAISKWLTGLDQQSKGVRVLQCDVDWQKIEVAGDMAYEWGINTQTISVPDRTEPVKNAGKITLILRKQPDNSWKLVLESWNGSPQGK